jgi:hypothetical protein
MKRLFTCLLIFLSIHLFAQVDTIFYTTELDVDVTTTDFKDSRNKLLDFLKQNQLPIQNQNESRTLISLKIHLSKDLYEQLDEKISSLGYVMSRKVNTLNNSLKVNDINLEITYLKSKKDSYTELMKQLDVKSDMYISLWNENKLTEEKIFKKEKELLPYIQKTHNYTINVTLSEEKTSPENSKISFVNMPGFEYSYLTIESPSASISSKHYQGYFLKYLFTKGKSFATIGAYTSIPQSSNNNTRQSTTDSLFSELFVIGFGQDFYSRHLGRGSRKFLNLYSGYNAGYMLATGVKTKENIFYISPTIGLEIFKNKYILIDTKFTYLIPFMDNKNLRGYTLNTSINFVF